jgi:enamine deaminase RidA (YjgF/YER057c/UK114 family)
VLKLAAERNPAIPCKVEYLGECCSKPLKLSWSPLLMFKRHTPTTIHPPFSNYAFGLEVPAGHRLLFCSGQLGIALDATIPEDAGAQTALCFENIRAVLASAGMDFSNIVRINAYVTGREYLPAYMAVRNGLFPIEAPASTLMIVSGFAREIFKVEIEVIAAAADKDA